ncbi:hypothetical protein PYCC9005_002034 [Savitreella phatthalungensis]
MAIKRLPESQSRALRSAQVCSDVPAIIKELVENALDAGATSIYVSLDGYGLDEISVRDNGKGITVEDASKVALFGHTSKLDCMHSLRSVRFYGFRGEALASLADVSASFALVTRTSDEAIARHYRLVDGVLRQLHTSSDPVGTTIIASKIFARTPVRRNKMIKDGPRNASAKLRAMLSAYAVACPHVRFHATIRSTRKGETPAIFTLPASSSRIESLNHAFAPDAARNFFEISTEGSVAINAILPLPNLDPAVIPKGKVLVLVDARPMDISRGFAKRMVAVIKDVLLENCSDYSTPSFVVELRGQPGTYDQNFEQKAEVVFEEEEEVLSNVKEAVHAAYALEDTADLSVTDAHGIDEMPEPTAQSIPVFPTPRSTVNSSGSGHVAGSSLAMLTPERQPRQFNPSPSLPLTPRPTNTPARVARKAPSELRPTVFDRMMASREEDNLEEDVRPAKKPRTAISSMKEVISSHTLDSFVQPQTVIASTLPRSPVSSSVGARVYNHEDIFPNSSPAKSPRKNQQSVLEKTLLVDQVHNHEVQVSSDLIDIAGVLRNDECFSDDLVSSVAEPAAVRLVGQVDGGMQILFGMSHDTISVYGLLDGSLDGALRVK